MYVDEYRDAPYKHNRGPKLFLYLYYLLFLCELTHKDGDFSNLLN